MVLIKYSMGIVRDVAIALGGLATVGLVVFGYLSWRREKRALESYKHERDYFEKSQRQDREDYAKERKFYETNADRRWEQESKLSNQQFEMAALGLTRFDAMLANQSKNIEALGHVLDVIARASDIRLQREERHEETEKMMKSLRLGAERRYLRAREEADRLRDIKAAQWPTLPLDRLQVAIGALRVYQSVDDFVKEEVEKNEKDSARHAAFLQRLGVFAYYADHNYEGAITYLSDALRIFGEGTVEDQFKPAQAWARHFLGVLKKNWPLRNEASGTSLRQAKELLAAAESYLSVQSNQFLTPLTHAEVLSYLPGERHAAETKVSKIIKMIEELREGGKADNVQLGLLPRAYLLRGNIAHIQGDKAAACDFFYQACKVANTNPYAWLSLAEATVNGNDAQQHWARGLSLLPKPPATDKPETSTRVLVFSWGVLASHFAGDSESGKSYRVALDDVGSLIEKEGKYTPLFFSPATKNLVDFDELKEQMVDFLSPKA